MPFGREESESGRDELSQEKAILFWFWQQNKLIGAGRGFHQHLCSQVLGNRVLWKPGLLNTLCLLSGVRQADSGTGPAEVEVGESPACWDHWRSSGMCWCWPMRSGSRWRSLLSELETPQTRSSLMSLLTSLKTGAVCPAHLAGICSTFSNVHGRLAWKNADVKWWLTEVLRFI